MTDEIDGVPVPLPIQMWLDGHCRQGIDLAERAVPHESDATATDVEPAYNHLTEQIQMEFEDLIMNSEVLFRDHFGPYIALSPADWKTYFGETPPGNIDSWEPITERMSMSLIATYQMQMEEWGRDMTIPSRLEQFTSKHFSHEDADEWPLTISVDPATEFDKLGLMTRPQALTYFLRSVGYTTNEIATLLDKNPGTVSSHGSRAEKKAAQYAHAAEALEFYDELPTNWDILGEKVGHVYEQDDGTQVRIIGGDESPSGHPVYYIQYQSGDVEQCEIDALDGATEIPYDSAEFPDIPDMFLERGFTDEPIEIDDDEPILDPDSDS
jgi:hypothetical protein